MVEIFKHPRVDGNVDVYRGRCYYCCCEMTVITIYIVVDPGLKRVNDGVIS